MAKKTPEVIDDDFDLDNFEDFDFDIPDPTVKDDRKPSAKIISGLKDGAVAKVKSPEFLKESLKHAFPPSFGRAVDMTEEVGRSAKNLYDDSVKEIKPTLLMAKKTISKLVPADSKMVPKKVQDVLQRWRNEPNEESYSAPSKDQMRDGLLGQTLKDIFEAQQATDQQASAEQTGRDNLKIGLQQVRYKTTLDALNRSAMSLKRLDDYSTTIGLSYQKKSLELQYRQLFAAQDILEFGRQDAQRRDLFLANIVKNTALPEFVKITGKEARAEMARRKRFDVYNSALFGSGDKMIADGLARMKKTVLNNTKSLMQDMRDGLQDASMAADMVKEGGMGGDPVVQAGAEAGGWGTQKIGNILAKKLYGKVEGSGLDKRFGITDKFHSLDGKLENLPNALNEFRKTRKYDYDNTLKGSFLNMLQGMVPSQDADKALVATTSKNLFEPSPFTVQTARSINEVIPGFLARILREVKVFRTGDDKITLDEFSHDKGVFVDRPALNKEVDEKVIPGPAVKRTRDSLNDLVGMIDDPQNKMSEEERKALKKRLLTNSADRNEAAPHRLAKAETYKKEGAADAVAQSVSQRMDSFFQKLSPEERSKFIRRHNQLTDNMADPRQTLQNLLETGNIEQLNAGKFIVQKGTDVRVNMEELIRRYLEDDLGDAGGGATGGSDSGGPDGKNPSSGPQRFLKKLGARGRLLKRQGKHKAKSMAQQAQQAASAAVHTHLPALPVTAASLAQQAQQATGQFSNRLKGYGAQAQNYAANFQLPQLRMPGVPSLQPEHKEALRNTMDVAQQHLENFSSKVASLVHPETLAHAAAGVAQLTQRAKAAVVPKLEGVTHGVQQLKDEGMRPGQSLVESTKPLVQAQALQIKTLGEQIATTHRQMAQLVKEAAGERKAHEAAGELQSKLQERKDKTLTRAKHMTEQVMAAVPKRTPSGLSVNAAPGVPAPSGVHMPSAELIARVDAAERERAEEEAKKEEAKKGLAFRFDPRKYVAPAALTRRLQGKKEEVAGQKELAQKPAVPSALSGVQDTLRAKAVASISATIDVNQCDLYVGTEKTPRITAAKMAQGLYFLKDGQKTTPITRMSEIKGTVVDEKGQVVISPQELNQLVYLNPVRGTWTRLYAKPINPTFGALTSLTDSLKAGAGALLKSASTFVEDRFKMGGPSDVYVAGEKEPRLYATKMAKGLYFDVESGEAITSPRQIKGPVRDETGQTVVDKDDLAKLNVYNYTLKRWSPLWLIAKGLKGLGWLTKKAWQFETGFAWKWTKWNFKMLGKGLKLAGSLLGLKKTNPTVDGVPFKDVYVAGEKTPRLEASKFMKGEYRNRRTGEVIQHPKDITDPVLDRNGNTLIDEEDLKNLVVYNTGLGRFSPLRILGKLLKLPFQAAAWAGKKLLKGALAVAKPVVKAGVAGAVAGTVAGAKGLLWAGKKVLGIERKAQKVDPMANALADVKENAERYKRLERMKSSVGSAIGKVKSLFGPKLGMAQLAELPVGEAAAVKSSSTLDKILAKVTAFTSPKKEKEAKDQYADDFKRDKDAGDEQNKLREDIDKKLHKDKPGAGDGKDKEEDKGLLGSLLDNFGLGDLLGGKGKIGKVLGKGGKLLGKIPGMGKLGGVLGKIPGVSRLGGLLSSSGGLGSLAGKLALPAAAAFSAWEGSKDEANGKHIENAKDIIPDGFLNKLNPFAYAMNGGRYVGDKLNKGYGAISSMLGGSGMLGGDVFSMFHKDPMKQMEEDEKNKKGPQNKAQDKQDQEKKDGLFSKLFDEKDGVFTKLFDGKSGFFKTLFDKLPFGTAKAEEVPAAKRAMPAAIDAPKAAPADSVTNGKNTVNPQLDPQHANGAAGTVSNNYGGQDASQPASPDAEAKPPETADAAVAAKPDAGGNAPSSIPSAAGKMFDGSNGLSFMALGKGVKIDGMNPTMRKELSAMVEEYNNITGKKVPINDGFRSSEDQARMYQKYGPKRAAKPGTSMHEFGLAVDIDSKTANEMEQLGLMRKYGFTRPVGQEPWHVEPIGTQTDLADAKKDSSKANDLILAGLGKGGGGLGIDPSSRKNSRSMENSLSVLKAADADPQKTPNAQIASKGIDFGGPKEEANGAPAGASTGASSAMAASSNKLADASAAGTAGLSSTRGPGASPSFGGSTDEGENKPTPVASLGLPKNNMYGSVRAGGNPMTSGPADPTAKVPAPTGSGLAGLRPTIEGACKLVGMDPNTVLSVMAQESGFDPSARAKTSSATGLGQFTNETWAGMMKRYARKYGIDPNTPATDPKAASIMTAQYLKDNCEALGKATGKPATATDAYMGHFLGTGGARSFLKAMAANPDAPAAQAMPKAAAANQSIFYDGQRPRSLKEIYDLMGSKLRDKAKAFGIDAPANPMGGSAQHPGGSPAIISNDYGGQDQGAETPASKPQAAPAAGGASLATAGLPASDGAAQSKAIPAAAMASMAGPALPSAAPTALPSAVPTPALTGGMDATVFAKAEDLLSKQLAVQEQMLDALKQLVKTGGIGAAPAPASADQASSQQAAAAPASPQPPRGAAYDIPKGAISMKRTVMA